MTSMDKLTAGVVIITCITYPAALSGLMHLCQPSKLLTTVQVVTGPKLLSRLSSLRGTYSVSTSKELYAPTPHLTSIRALLPGCQISSCFDEGLCLVCAINQDRGIHQAPAISAQSDLTWIVLAGSSLPIWLKVHAQAILSQLERPLLCTSAHVQMEGELEFPEAAVLMDEYADRNIDFLVDAGPQVRRTMNPCASHLS